MNLKAIALASLLGISAPTIATVAFAESASATTTNVRPNGAFTNDDQTWLVLLELDESGNYTYKALNRKTRASIALKNPVVNGNRKRYTYTFRNANYRYVIAHQPKNPNVIRLTVLNPEGKIALNCLMRRVKNAW